MADNAEATCRAITIWLGGKLGIATKFVDCISWQEREHQLDAGLIHVCWICGLPYVWKTDADDTVIEPCVALVMAAARYDGAPVYYSDIVVRRDTLLAMHTDQEGMRILAQWGMANFVAVGDASYDPIRHMAQRADNVRLVPG